MSVDPEELVRSVPDPELPFLTIGDLGIVRGLHAHGSTVRVQLTPTYSGCPAFESIRADVISVLHHHGYSDVLVEQVLSPAWTTDWLSDKGRAAMAEHGIAPPGPVLVPLSGPLRCPQCGSRDTEELSRFGATACKALHRCKECLEPFEHFKAH